jgi:putative FmdB family regulatory protein
LSIAYVTRRAAMPTYEFKCQACEKPFSATATVKELEEGTIKCPSCGSTNIQQLPTTFISKTSRKS